MHGVLSLYESHRIAGVCGNCIFSCRHPFQRPLLTTSPPFRLLSCLLLLPSGHTKDPRVTSPHRTLPLLPSQASLLLSLQVSAVSTVSAMVPPGQSHCKPPHPTRVATTSHLLLSQVSVMSAVSAGGAPFCATLHPPGLSMTLPRQDSSPETQVGGRASLSATFPSCWKQFAMVSPETIASYHALLPCAAHLRHLFAALTTWLLC